MKNYTLVVALLTIAIIVILYIFIKYKLSAKEETGEYLFSIHSTGNFPVSVDVDQHNISVYLLTKFSNIAVINKHQSYNLGNLMMIDLFFNRSKSNPVDTSGLPEDQKYVIDAIINTRNEAFILQQPKCTLSFTQTDVPISHIDTIGKMIKLETTTVGGNEFTVITFTILDGNTLIPRGAYGYSNITVDNSWDWLGFASAAIGTGIVCTTGEVGTAGATGACVGTLIETAAAYGKAVDEF